MAAANESQGLKIAVAVFVTLSVIMAVFLYFSYKNYTETDAKLTKANQDLSTANKTADGQLREVESLRKEVIGVRAEESEAVKAELKNEYKKVNDEIQAMIDQVKAAISQAQGAGLAGAELDDAKNKVDQIAAAYRAEPNKNLISAHARLTDLLKNMSLLLTRVALNYVEVKRGLEGANGVNANKLGVVEKALSDSKADVEAEHKKHEEDRGILMTKVDQFTTENSRLNTELASATAKLRQQEEEFSKKLALAQQTIREYRDKVERSETVLDRPDGQVTFVNYLRGEIHTNLRRSTGARPQMVFSIFDSASPGLPTDKPKGTVELIQVGETSSIARIIKTNANIDPIRVGDFVYSAAWSPNEPIHFALIGKIDVNQDGNDDRADLKRMIEAAGGIVDYDLPPPFAGKESGKLTGRDAWYVINADKEGNPAKTLRQRYTNVREMTDKEAEDFTKRESEVTKEARLLGIRPMPLQRLLPYLGYDFAAPHLGHAEATDTAGLRRLVEPRQGATKPKAPTDAPAGDAAPKEEMPKEEMPKDAPK